MIPTQRDFEPALERFLDKIDGGWTKKEREAVQCAFLCCRDLLSTLDATGGVDDGQSSVRPHGDPEWIDLGWAGIVAEDALRGAGIEDVRLTRAPIDDAPAESWHTDLCHPAVP